MKLFTREAARRYMEVEVESVPSCTQLAENCAHEFDEDAALDDPDHFVWEVALEVWEEKHGDF